MLSRPEWIATLARASAEELAAALSAAAPLPAHRRLRGPETGLTMLRGRAG
ncbi:MAG: phosphonate C-P lyase system protein PhnG, partial [Roseococcus sp.]